MADKITVADVLQSEAFKKELLAELDSIANKRAAFCAKHNNCTLKRSAYDSLGEKGLLNDDELVTCYTLILTKSMKGMSRAERDMVCYICEPAFNRTARTLLAEQETANK